MVCRPAVAFRCYGRGNEGHEANRGSQGQRCFARGTGGTCCRAEVGRERASIHPDAADDGTTARDSYYARTAPADSNTCCYEFGASCGHYSTSVHICGHRAKRRQR
jgi:hypothetical protein